VVRADIVGCTEDEVMTARKYIFAACVVSIAVGVAGVAHLSYRSGYKSAITKISKAVNASQYPTIRVALPSREAVAVIIGGICTPIVPTFRIPELAHIEYIGAYDHRCGPGKAGVPYADSAALAAIKEQVDAIH
jgi:hypothetical protein